MTPSLAERHPADSIGRETLVALDPRGRLRPLALAVEEPPDVELSQRSLKIRLARSAHQQSAARLLIRRMYAGRGYRLPLNERDANRVCLAVSDADRVVGTLTLALDGEAELAAEALYAAELDALRRQGRRLCEITRLAADPAAGARQVLFALFHIAYIYARRLKSATDAVIEVNPMHVRFYQRALGFEQLGEERTCPRVGAPAVLLRLDFHYVAAQLARFAGRPELARNEKSLYPYAFSEIEEAGIAQRLARLLA